VCHSTNFQKNYDQKTKTYHTTWSEINVGCQACHGPGKQHLEWAKDALSGKANNIKNKGFILQNKITSHQKIEVCASCHSRRHKVSANDEYGEPLFDHFMPALLRNDLYYPDGQIKDEVFVYGSFLQSKMHRAGVTCMDCHNPHTSELKQTGNGLCVQCHNENLPKRFSGLKSKNYNSPAHTHHKPNSTGAQCINCHMPEKAYMQIDFRRDHSFRIPRPDLTEKIGVPNTCNQCHTDKSAKWASNTIQKWFGEKTFPQHYGELFAKAQAGEQDVEVDLIKLSQDIKQQNIVRATAIERLAQYTSPERINARIGALTNEDVLIREAAVRSLSQLPLQELITKLAPLLKDPVRAVRIETASILASVPKELMPDQYHQVFEQALDEYKSLQESNLDMPSGYFNLGNLYQNQGDHDKAIDAYQSAIDLDKRFYLAGQNLATLFHSLGRYNEAKQVLREGIKQNKEQGELYYSLGLLLAEQGAMSDAIQALASASKLLPQNTRVQYNFALALQGLGEFKKAETILTKQHALHANDADVLYALITLHMHQKNWEEALKLAEKLSVLFPESGEIRILIDTIKSRK